MDAKRTVKKRGVAQWTPALTVWVDGNIFLIVNFADELVSIPFTKLRRFDMAACHAALVVHRPAGQRLSLWLPATTTVEIDNIKKMSSAAANGTNG